jgi:hypothetical protein
MPNISKDKIWVSVGVRYGLWLILKKRADENKSSVQKEMEKILSNELKEMVEANKK